MRLWQTAVVAAVLLFWGLNEKYLWEDEANTAVLATRILRFGKPLAYDGKNFVGLDDSSMEDLEPIGQRTGNARAVIDFYIRHGFVKPDTTWKWHPWGSFIMAAVSIRLLGQTTLAARLPFAVAGLLTVLLLYRLTLECGGKKPVAEMAAALLTFNGYWILHERQCRYYAPSCLMLVVTMLCYARWQRGSRRGLAFFVVAAWCWFQVDYGTFWPVLAVLFTDAIVAHWRKPWGVLTAGAMLAGSIAPFVWYYELWGRRGIQEDTWMERFRVNVFNGNEFVLPMLILGIAVMLLARRWDRMVAVACGIVAAMAIWVPSMAPDAFLRYLIIAAPVGCFITAWVVFRIVPEKLEWAIAAVLAVTPWASMPLHPLVKPPHWHPERMLVRSELGRMREEVFSPPFDVNRVGIEWLRAHAAPSDEIVANYEDLPLMYYLPNPIRGGIAAFRVEDETPTPPRYMLLRPDIPFVDEDSFDRERTRHRWAVVKVADRSSMWGNNPDPMAKIGEPENASLVLLRRVDQ